jgi:hypothetical protein
MGLFSRFLFRRRQSDAKPGSDTPDRKKAAREDRLRFESFIVVRSGELPASE